ncbi:uncharacterized protein BcabD6B2_04930 [Babesia caballi]|uniref:Uncharacterized protein n=1 Tax=Babesia caballi TaxID=5871 RepID=A0AAV4LMI0_BABCB|nr:hypothetical protein BcabD6B2_04930 [Babesia caballi]
MVGDGLQRFDVLFGPADQRRNVLDRVDDRLRIHAIHCVHVAQNSTRRFPCIGVQIGNVDRFTFLVSLSRIGLRCHLWGLQMINNIVGLGFSCFIRLPRTFVWDLQKRPMGRDYRAHALPRQNSNAEFARRPSVVDFPFIVWHLRVQYVLGTLPGLVVRETLHAVFGASAVVREPALHGHYERPLVHDDAGVYRRPAYRAPFAIQTIHSVNGQLLSVCAALPAPDHNVCVGVCHERLGLVDPVVTLDVNGHHIVFCDVRRAHNRLDVRCLQVELLDLTRGKREPSRVVVHSACRLHPFIRPAPIFRRRRAGYSRVSHEGEDVHEVPELVRVGELVGQRHVVVRLALEAH